MPTERIKKKQYMYVVLTKQEKQRAAKPSGQKQNRQVTIDRQRWEGGRSGGGDTITVSLGCKITEK